MEGCEIRTGQLEKTRSRRKTAVRGLPVRQRPSTWRDVRLAFARELSSVTKTYVPRQGLPRVVGGLKSFDDVGHELFCAAVGCGLSSRTQVVGVAYGGNGVFELLDATFSPLQFILDTSHLKQHLYETADAIGLQDAPRERWVNHLVTQCDQGNVHRARAALRRHRGRGKTRCDRLHGYQTRIFSSVHYDAYRKMGYPIGSGEIESGHRVIPAKALEDSRCLLAPRLD